MFRKRCSKCDRKVSKGYDFCPYCGSSFQKKADYGLLGKNDDISNLDSMFGNSFGNNNGFGGSIIEKMLGNAMKILEKEIRHMDRPNEEIQKTPNLKTNFELFINGKKVNIPQNFNGNISGIKINPGNNQETEERKIKNIPKVSEETIKKASKLPRKEAKTKLTRLKEKVIYELETPGIEGPENILINQLENSLEVKAYTKKAVYFKNITIKLPLVRYGVDSSEGKLVLEFKTQ